MSYEDQNRLKSRVGFFRWAISPSHAPQDLTGHQARIHHRGRPSCRNEAFAHKYSHWVLANKALPVHPPTADIHGMGNYTYQVTLGHPNGPERSQYRIEDMKAYSFSRATRGRKDPSPTPRQPFHSHDPVQVLHRFRPGYSKPERKVTTARRVSQVGFSFQP